MAPSLSCPWLRCIRMDCDTVKEQVDQLLGRLRFDGKHRVSRRQRERAKQPRRRQGFDSDAVAIRGEEANKRVAVDERAPGGLGVLRADARNDAVGVENALL